MGFRCLVPLLFLLVPPAFAVTPAAACDGPDWQTVLTASSASLPARAVWLDDSRLQWPGVQPGAGERLRLLHSAEGTLAAPRGEAATGFDAAFALGDTAPAASDTRYSYLAAGVRAALTAGDRDRLRSMLPGQWMLVREDEAGRVQEAAGLQWPGLLDALFAPAQALSELGASVQRGRSTRFVLWAPTARSVSVCVYPRHDQPALSALGMRRDDATGAWSVQLPRDHSGGYYAYLVEVFVPGVGWVRNRVTDPYAVSLGTDSRRAYIADLADPRLMPPGWAIHSAPATVHANTDMVVYELHVRDFSASDESVPAAHRGQYLAFTDTASRGMRHLRALAKAGLTDVHLLPVFDFATIPEAGCRTPTVPRAAPDSPAQQAAAMAGAAGDCFNWGYDPLHYSAPEGSYASDAADGAVRVREFRSLVMALHRAGLRVGMDVVYNHTAASGQQQKSVLDRIVPG